MCLLQSLVRVAGTGSLCGVSTSSLTQTLPFAEASCYLCKQPSRPCCQLEGLIILSVYILLPLLLLQASSSLKRGTATCLTCKGQGSCTCSHCKVSASSHITQHRACRPCLLSSGLANELQHPAADGLHTPWSALLLHSHG